MRLEVGVNSYINCAEADDIVENEIYGDSEEYNEWLGMSEHTKETLLIHYTRKLDKLVYLGNKSEPGTELSYPRIINGILTPVPYDIKVAIISQGLRERINNRKEEIKLQDLGVKSYSIDGASISFSSHYRTRLRNGIYKDIFENYLARHCY